MTDNKSPGSLSDDSSGVLDLSDEELTANTRAGSIAAFEELWQRHSVFGIQVARAETPSQANPANAAAWQAMLVEIQAGRGPQAAFRPYLYSQVHRAATQLTGEEAPVDADSAHMTQALSVLPARWQEVLWYLDVEKMSPEDVCLLTGLTPESIMETRARARRGLKDSWLKVNADQAPLDSDCRWVREHAHAYLNKTLPQEGAAVITTHLDACDQCRKVVRVAKSMGSTVPALLLAGASSTVAGAALAGYLTHNGPVVINEDPLPTAAAVAFSVETIAPVEADVPTEQRPQTYHSQEHRRRRRSALIIALIIAAALIAAIILVAWLASRADDPDPQTSPTPVMTSPTPSGTESIEPTAPTGPGSVEATPTPSDSSSPTPDPTEAPTPTPSPTEEPTETEAPAPQAPAAAIGGIDDGGGTLEPIIFGTAAPGDTVTAQVGADTVTATANASGDWSINGPYPSLGAGPQTVSVTTSTNSTPATSSFSISAPPTPVISTNSQGRTTVALSGGVPGASVQILIDGSAITGVIAADGTYLSNQALAPGNHTFAARYYSGGRFGLMSTSITV
ncbi:MAG: zf-HC2 domain-containing protein [Propionibacteriaceae bacterium]|jgi:hypothetical protein|nr:zf-HC2 domain-containing protein [Propionibacteriaceae bacterium]